MARRRRRKSRSSYAAARKRALSRMNAGRNPRRRRRARRNKGVAGGTAYKTLQKRVSKLGVSPIGKTREQLERILSSAPPGRKRKPAKRKGSKRRRSSAGSRVASARRSLATVRREVTKAEGAAKRARASASAAGRNLSKARSSLKRRPQRKKRRKSKARKNPNAMGIARYAGSFVGGFAISNLLQNSLHKLEMVKEAETKWLPEYAAPAVLAGGLWWATKKRELIKDDIGMGLIAGVAGAVLSRQVPFIGNLPGIRHMLGWLAMGVEPFALQTADKKFAELARNESGVLYGKDAVPLEAFYAGAAGMGRYLTDDSIDGMGRYLQDDSIDGMGRFVTVPVSGLGAMDDETEELLDEVAGATRLTVAEAQAENIDPNLPVVRATPSSAQRLSNANIGQVLGQSRQVPGTYLVVTTVAGRDIDLTTGPRAPGADYPAAGRPFEDQQIRPAENISISPHGVFSRGVFSSVLPTHAGYSV